MNKEHSSKSPLVDKDKRKKSTPVTNFDHGKIKENLVTKLKLGLLMDGYNTCDSDLYLLEH